MKAIGQSCVVVDLAGARKGSGMSDSRSAYDEQLPWLRGGRGRGRPRGVSARRMLAALLVVLAAVALVSATFFWLGRRDERKPAERPS